MFVSGKGDAELSLAAAVGAPWLAAVSSHIPISFLDRSKCLRNVYLVALGVSRYQHRGPQTTFSRVASSSWISFGG